LDALRNAYAEFHDPNRALGGRPSTRWVSSSSWDGNSWAARRCRSSGYLHRVLQNRANLGLCGSLNDLQVAKRKVTPAADFGGYTRSRAVASHTKQPLTCAYLVARAAIEPATFRFSVEDSRHAATVTSVYVAQRGWP
jgi:hypothetical protein